jgi:multidrug resistance efflux pump
MAIRLHKQEERPLTPDVERARVTKTRGFPRFVLWLFIAAVVVVGGYFAIKWNRIQVRGVVTAAYDDFTTEARCRITGVNVKVGDEVKAGQVLLTSESIDPRSQIRQYEAALDEAKLRLELATRGGDVGEVDLSKRPRSLTDAREAADVAQARLAAAQKSEKEYEDLAKATEADRAKETEKARVDIATAAEKLNQARASEKEVAVELAQARLNLDKAKELYADDAATLNDVQLAQTKHDFLLATAEKARSASTEAENFLSGARKILEATTGKYDAELRAQRSRCERAKADTAVAEAFLTHSRANLTRAEAEFGELKTDPKQMQADELDLLRKRVEEARGRLDYHKNLAGTVEFKPRFDGIVSELTKQVGDVASNEKIIAVYDPTTVAIEAYVPEDDFHRVHVGLKARVRIRGTDVEFEGEVTSVNTAPARLPGEMKVAPSPETAYDRFITCRIDVPLKSRTSITPAMRANVTIFVAGGRLW